MPFKKSTKINDWAMNPGVEVDDSSNDFQGQTWQFRVAILPTKENLEKALTALNNLPLFKEENHPTAKLIQIDNTDLTTWDGTIADASDRDQRGKELCVYLPYDSAGEKFRFNQTEVKKMMLDIWKALQDADVKISYTTPSQDEKELESDLIILTPFSYSSFKPYSSPDGILHYKDYNPKGHPDPLKGLHFSKTDLQRKGITTSDALTISQSRVEYMKNHYQTTAQSLKDTIEKLKIREKPSPYTSLINRINQAIKSDDETIINGLLSDFKKNYNEIYKNFPTEFKNGTRFPIIEDGRVIFLLKKDDAINEKKAFLAELQANAAKAIETLQTNLTAQNWPIEKPDENEIRELASTSPYELQAIQRQLVHLSHESSAINKEQLRHDEIQKIVPESNNSTSPVKSSLITGSIAGAVGLAIGASVGVALVMTGVFAPFGIGVLGIVALAAVFGVGAGVLSSGIFGGLAYNKKSNEIAKASAHDPKPVVESKLTQESSRALSQLSDPSSTTSSPQVATNSQMQINIDEQADMSKAEFPASEKGSVLNRGKDQDEEENNQLKP